MRSHCRNLPRRLLLLREGELAGLVLCVTMMDEMKRKWKVVQVNPSQALEHRHEALVWLQDANDENHQQSVVWNSRTVGTFPFVGKELEF